MNLHWTFEIHVLVKSRVISNDEIKVASTGCEGMPKVSIRTEDGAWTKKEEKEKKKRKKKVLFHSLGVSHSQSLLSVSLCFRSFKSSPQRCTIACLYSQDSGMWSGKLDWSSSVSSPKRLIGERMSCNQREERWRVKNEENRTTKWDFVGHQRNRGWSWTLVLLKPDEKTWRSIASKAEDRPRRVKARPTIIQSTQDIVSHFE